MMKLFTPYTSEDEIPTYYHDFLVYIWYPFCNMISIAIINNGFYNSHLKNYDYEKGISSSSISNGIR